VLEPVQHDAVRLPPAGGTRTTRAYGRQHGASQASRQEVPHMSDKSPRQSMTKKTGKSIKEKRAAKRDAAEETSLTKESPRGKKR